MYEGTIFFGRQGAVIQAMSGVEIALWDIVGKATKRPVYQLLGGAFRKKLRAYASILFGETPADTERTARALAGQRYRAVQFGWGPKGAGEGRRPAPGPLGRKGSGRQFELEGGRGPLRGPPHRHSPGPPVRAVQPHLARRAASSGQYRRLCQA